MRTLHLRKLFADDPSRARCMALENCGLFADFSKNRISDETITLLLDFAHNCLLSDSIAAMFAGAPINFSEHRAALHVALRAPQQARFTIANHDVMQAVLHERSRLFDFAERVRRGIWTTQSGKPIRDVVHLGIGGSLLGPQMVCTALADGAHPDVRVHFVSGIDGVQLDDVLAQIKPATSLFIIASKSFNTLETLNNAQAARSWLQSHLGQDKAVIASHFIAVSNQIQAALAFGIERSMLFTLPDWVGGRFSLWSAIGLPIVLQNGAAAFQALLDGAHAMDEHFRSSPLRQHLPVMLALIDIWNIDFLQIHSLLIAPYHQRLSRLPTYLQQLEMESNGKSTRIDGQAVIQPTSPVLWGESGIEGQHAYFQMLHQGTQLIATELIGVIDRGAARREHDIAMACLLAQSQALMQGRTVEEATTAMQQAGMPHDQIRRLLPHRCFTGNRPSNVLLLDRLDPYCLGALLALYEHRTFCHGVIWGVNSFDQWGVELGKELTTKLLEKMSSPGGDTNLHDASTLQLLARYRSHRPTSS